MDDVTSTLSGSVATGSTAGTSTIKPFAGKPRRLARGLNDLFARQPEPVKVTPVEEPPASSADRAEGKRDAVTRDAEAKRSESAPQADAKATTIVEARTEPATSAQAAPAADAVVVTAAPSDATAASLAAFEYRFVQLFSRLDATCNLLADARQSQQAAVQRTSRVTLSAAAVLVIIAGGMLWWAGSLASWNQSKYEYESSRSAVLEKNFHQLTAQHASAGTTHQSLAEQHKALVKQHEVLVKQHESVRGEIDAIRTSLAKANGVIDQLMTAPKVEPKVEEQKAE